MMGCRRNNLFFRMASSIFCSLVVLLVGSCLEDYEKNVIRPEFDVLNWDNPNSYNLKHSIPSGIHVTPDSRYLICDYLIESETTDASAACIVDLISQELKWFTVPYHASVRPLSATTLGVFVTHPSFVDLYNGYFLDIDSLTLTGPAIPSGLPFSSEESQFVAVVKWEEHKEDVWLYNLASESKIIMPASQHGLNRVMLVVSTDRLLIYGLTYGYHEPPDRRKIQLWKLPELEKIWEHETKDTFPWRSLRSPFSFSPLILGKDSFCFAHTVGLRRIASLSSGEVRFSIRNEVPGQFCWIVSDSGYVDDTGRIVCLKTSANNKRVDIKTYDIKTGRELHTVIVPYGNFEFIKVVEVAEEWIVLCGWSDPKDEPTSDAPSISPRKMWIVAYRLIDLKKIKHSMEITWGGFHQPEFVDGQLISVITDHALIYDLSTVVTFDAK